MKFVVHPERKKPFMYNLLRPCIVAVGILIIWMLVTATPPSGWDDVRWMLLFTLLGFESAYYYASILETEEQPTWLTIVSLCLSAITSVIALTVGGLHLWAFLSKL